jgi:hypothetical protein
MLCGLLVASGMYFAKVAAATVMHGAGMPVYLSR